MRRSTQSESRDLADSLTQYLDRIGRYRLLTRDEEVELGRRIHLGDREALDRLVCANLRFVVSIAKKYQSRNVALADLINEGNLGLIRAAHKFDETKGIKFISYAVWWIRQAVLQARAEQSRLVRVPMNQVGTIWHTHLSLDARMTPGQDNRLVDYLPDDLSPPPDEQLLDKALTQSIGEALTHLKDREAKILRLYFGLDGDEPMTLEQIGAILGVTRERVRQIRDRALRQLRASLPELALTA
jgi:RNA polymerase primary sigma factor